LWLYHLTYIAACQRKLRFQVSATQDIREQSPVFAPEESHHYFAQIREYQVLPEQEMVSIQRVILNMPIG
jgi:hypothetical protein